MGIRGIGADIDPELVRGMRWNIEYYRLKNQILLCGDARELSYLLVDGIATDPPYGRAASTHGLDVLEVYMGFLEKAYYSVKRGGYIVFMAPLALENEVDEILCRIGLVLRNKHYIYVHGTLTRIIYEVVNP